MTVVASTGATAVRPHAKLRFASSAGDTHRRAPRA